MLNILGGRFGTCDGVSRRSFLRVGALGLAGLTLPDVLRARAQAATRGEATKNTAVIQVFLSGGPTHLETYDLKPDAPKEIRGEFKPIASTLPGVQISEYFPPGLIARQDGDPPQPPSRLVGPFWIGTHWAMTGFPGQQPAADERAPQRGLDRRKAPRPQRARPAIREPPEHAHIRGGVLSGRGVQPVQRRRRPEYQRAGPQPRPGRRPEPGPAGGSRLPADAEARPDRAASRRRLGHDGRDRPLHGPGLRDGHRPGRPRGVRPQQGRPAPQGPLRPDSGFGQGCLLARRLVEAGVTFVTLTEGNWDHHAQVFQQCRNQLPPLDNAVATLVEDLHDRGLADRVLVLVWGEFGRSPKINNGGRDHWPNAMSAMIAGGGLKMGQVIGATNRMGESPSERPLRPEDLIQTVYHVLGINPQHEFLNESGRPMPVLNRGHVISELIA